MRLFFVKLVFNPYTYECSASFVNCEYWNMVKFRDWSTQRQMSCGAGYRIVTKAGGTRRAADVSSRQHIEGVTFYACVQLRSRESCPLFVPAFSRGVSGTRRGSPVTLSCSQMGVSMYDALCLYRTGVRKNQRLSMPIYCFMPPTNAASPHAVRHRCRVAKALAERFECAPRVTCALEPVHIIHSAERSRSGCVC